MRLKLLVLLMAAAALAFACGEEQASEVPGKKVGKGDCPDCDPHLGSAFEQAEMGLRFYLTGDAWQVAYQFKVRNDMAREALRYQQLPDDPTEFAQVQQDLQVSVSDVFLFDYRVQKVDDRVIDNVKRGVALLSVEQGTASSALYSQDRLDTHEFKLEFEMDDLLRPLREIYYNRQYPNGKTIEVDQESSLSGLDSGSNLFPHTVPRVLTSGADSEAPAMTPELEAIADAQLPDWRTAKYRKFQFANGDLVFWAEGALWPFFVDSQQGYGLLVSQTLIAR